MEGTARMERVCRRRIGRGDGGGRGAAPRESTAAGEARGRGGDDGSTLGAVEETAMATAVETETARRRRTRRARSMERRRRRQQWRRRRRALVDGEEATADGRRRRHRRLDGDGDGDGTAVRQPGGVRAERGGRERFESIWGKRKTR